LDHRRIPRPREVVSHFLIFLTLTTVALAQPLLQLYGNNLTVFSAAQLQGIRVAFFGGLVICVPPLIFIAIEVVVTALLPMHRQLVHRVLVLIAFWLVVLLIFRSAPLGPWPLAFVLTAAVACGAIQAYMRWSAMMSWIRAMSPMALVVLLVFGIAAKGVIRVPNIGAAKVKLTHQTDAVEGTNRGDMSVALLILDELPLFALLDADGAINKERFPGFAELASASTWYRNDVATSQSTPVAVPSILTGKFPKTGVDPILANYPRNIFTLLGGSMTMDVREIVTLMCPRPMCSKVIFDNANAKDSGSKKSSSSGQEFGIPLNFVKDALIVMAHKILPRGLRNHLPPIDNAWGGFAPRTDGAKVDSNHLQSKEVIPRKELADKWHVEGPVSQLPAFDGFIERVSGTSLPTFHMLHTLLPHRPWMLTSDLRTFKTIGLHNKVPDSEIEALNEYRVFLQQLMATDRLIMELLTKLKKSANWDRTMLVVTADHGITMEAGVWKRSQVDPDKPETHEDLYRVPLFIKYPDQKVSEVNDCTASPVDVLPTIAAVKGVMSGWKLDGTDLRKGCKNRPNRRVLWPNGEGVVSTGFEAAQERANFYSKMVPFDRGQNGAVSVYPYGALMDLKVPISILRDTHVSSWTLDQTERLKNVETGPLVNIPLEVSGVISVKDQLPLDAVGLMVVDGKVAGMIAGLGGLKAGSSFTYRSMLTAESLTKGSHEVALAIVVGGARKPHVTYAGLPS